MFIMKKSIFILILLIIFSYIVSANEIKKTEVQPMEDEVTSASADFSGLRKKLRASTIVHGIFGGIGLAGMTAGSVTGQILLSTFYANSGGVDAVTSASEETEEEDAATGASVRLPAYYTGLKYAHAALLSTSYVLMTTSMIMSFVNLGVKIKNEIPINIPHFVSSIVTTVFYVFELFSMILAGYAYSTKAPYAKEIGLAHGISSYMLVASYTLTLIMIPVGMKHKKVLGRR